MHISEVKFYKLQKAAAMQVTETNYSWAKKFKCTADCMWQQDFAASSCPLHKMPLLLLRTIAWNTRSHTSNVQSHLHDTTNLIKMIQIITLKFVFKTFSKIYLKMCSQTSYFDTTYYECCLKLSSCSQQLI